MSMENTEENTNHSNDPSQTPERGGGRNEEMFDAEGKPRISREMPDGSIIWASEQEYVEAVKAFNKEM